MRGRKEEIKKITQRKEQQETLPLHYIHNMSKLHQHDRNSNQKCKIVPIQVTLKLTFRSHVDV